MKVSIVIPCYNLGAYVNDAIGSVLSQTFQDFEIIVIDDGSTDEETVRILDSVRHENVEVIHIKNRGLAGAKNFGVSKARGEYIVCLDADDMLAPDYINKTVSELDKDKEKKLGFVSTWLREFGIRENLWKTEDFNIPKLLMENVIHAGSMFRKSVWSEVGGFKKMKIGGYEDWDFWLSIAEKGYEWTTVNEPLFYYRIRENSMLVGAKSSHVDIYAMLYDLHKDLFKKYFRDLILENSHKAKELHDAIRAKNESIQELEKHKDDIVELRSQVFKLRDEIHFLRNSRVLGKVIKARDSIGEIRNKVKHIPSSSVHKLRVIVAPFVPSRGRKSLKKVYKKSRDILLGVRPPTLQWVQNNRWESVDPLVSVIIPFYNRADTIDETLESLNKQTFNNFETIIVNDGSTDKASIKKLVDLKKSHPKIEVINQKNSGVANARNSGIRHSKSRYIICLDSDDLLEPAYIEKSTLLLESNPEISLISTHKNMFGVINERYDNAPFSPTELLQNNMVNTAAEYRRDAWHDAGGYKSGIGYEDWEFWINLSELGYWGKLIPEALFDYRTSMQSRYVEDKDVHWKNVRSIRELHPKYKRNIKSLLAKRKYIKNVIDPSTAFINLNNEDDYKKQNNNIPNILLALPWMTFGGAETLIVNFCNEIRDTFNLSFITGLESAHEWEYKFKEITPNIYHLSNLFEEPTLYLEFISTYIKTRHIDILHIIHTSFMFEMLPELKKRHPNLKIIVTVFNDRAHFSTSVEKEKYIDAFSSDNQSVVAHYIRSGVDENKLTVIPNGINSYENFNPSLYNRINMRASIGIGPGDVAVFFIGRLSEEKNPDVFLKAAENIVNSDKTGHTKFFVIGDGAMRSQVEETIAKIKSENIKYLGYQSEIAKYLSAADIFVLPSSIEGFPLSILEAMAMKVVVVASDVGAISEVITTGDDGLVVTPGSAPEFTDAIKKLANDPTMLETMKNKSRQEIEKKYSNTILGKNYTALYKKLLRVNS